MSLQNVFRERHARAVNRMLAARLDLKQTICTAYYKIRTEIARDTMALHNSVWTIWSRIVVFAVDSFGKFWIFKENQINKYPQKCEKI